MGSTEDDVRTFFVHSAVAFDRNFKICTCERFPGCNDRIAVDAFGIYFSAVFRELFSGKETVYFTVRVVVGGLCAEPAVLAAAAAAAVDDAAEICAVTAEFFPDEIRAGSQLGKIRRYKKGKIIFGAQSFSVDDLMSKMQHKKPPCPAVLFP